MPSAQPTTRSLFDIVADLFQAADVADAMFRVARGEGYVPRTAAEMASALVEAEAEQARADALEAEAHAVAQAQAAAMDAEAADDFFDHYAETRGQFDSEVAQFGDAGPGQGIHVAAMRLVASALRAKGA